MKSRRQDTVNTSFTANDIQQNIRTVQTGGQHTQLHQCGSSATPRRPVPAPCTRTFPAAAFSPASRSHQVRLSELLVVRSRGYVYQPFEPVSSPHQNARDTRAAPSVRGMDTSLRGRPLPALRAWQKAGQVEFHRLAAYAGG